MVTSGTVTEIKVNNSVGSDYAFFSVAVEGGRGVEYFYLWSTVGLQESPTVTQRLLWTTQLALLRDALTNKLPVLIVHDDTSAFVQVLAIFQAR
jgi:hypothetical protein